jgi:hypothetical protein
VIQGKTMTNENNNADPQHLPAQMANLPGAVPFKVDLSKPADLVASLFGPGTTFVHPCDAFARRAGYASWADALVAMKAGKILTATGPSIGKSTLDHDMFVEQVRAEGLISVAPAHAEFGFVSVGPREHFPAKMLEGVEEEASRLRRGGLQVDEMWVARQAQAPRNNEG